MAKRHVKLADGERAALEQQEAGPLTRRQRHRVQVLPRADAGDTDPEVADEGGASIGTVANVRRRSAAGGWDAAPRDRPRPGAVPGLGGQAEAVVIAAACSPVPEGRVKWTARMPADGPAGSQAAEGVSEGTILRVLEKADSSRGRRGRGACPGA